jgi:hypothetical protein
MTDLLVDAMKLCVIILCVGGVLKKGKNLVDRCWCGKREGWRLWWGGERVRIGYDDLLCIKLVVLIAAKESAVHVTQRLSLCLFKFYFLWTISHLQQVL